MTAKATTPKDTGDDRLKTLDKTVADITKKFGKGIVKGEADTSIPRWPLLSPNLNRILGGGLPKARIVEIFGPESTGKTALSVIMAADVQNQGGNIGFIDAEHSFSSEYANQLGLDLDPKKLTIFGPDSGEAALEVTEQLSASGVFDIVIVDSVSALTPQAEIDGDMGDSHMGLQARLMSQAMRKLTGQLNKTGCTIIFINQIRMKIGVVFGNPETTSGGNALKFYSSIRLEVRRVENINGTNQDVIGIRNRVKCIKNKTAPPMRKAEFEYYFDSGIDVFAEYVDLGVTYGSVIKSGSWYSVGEERIGQGKANAANFLREHENVFAVVKAQVDQTIDPSLKKEEEPAPTRKTKDKPQSSEGSKTEKTN